MFPFIPHTLKNKSQCSCCTGAGIHALTQYSIWCPVILIIISVNRIITIICDYLCCLPNFLKIIFTGNIRCYVLGKCICLSIFLTFGYSRLSSKLHYTTLNSVKCTSVETFSVIAPVDFSHTYIVPCASILHQCSIYPVYLSIFDKPPCTTVFA